MSLHAEIVALRRRINAKKAAGRSIFHDVARLQLMVLDELRAGVEDAQREQARDRRDPGSFQRELELDDA